MPGSTRPKSPPRSPIGGPDVTVICGTSIIRPEILAHMSLAINVHAGHLPEYRGNQCIFIALYQADYERVGASLHVATRN
jgi:methionyl-tRNA formyltransferase